MYRQRAFTLIEILITIVVVSVAAAALLSVFSNFVSKSADPVIQQQATTIAEAYMEEIQLRAFTDPQGGESGGAEAGESRATFDDVQDYNSLIDNNVRDQNNNLIAVLSDYTVTVSVTGEVLNTVNAQRIEVTVDHPAVQAIVLTGYRTDY
ncbi:MAG: prepilin-type N-terminal cleavage/methylation domain-containing protein [Pseudomonadota bacterium]